MKKYEFMKIGIASPEEIVSWANPELQNKEFTYDPNHREKVTYVNEAGETVECRLKGEVKNAETINYRSQKPVEGGLFCEVIFGPTKDYQCACGKPQRKSGKEHTICPKCGVEFTESKVRRERMGYIALAAPVVHSWYLRNTPSKIATILNRKTKEIEEIVYCVKYYVDEIYDESIITEDFKVGAVITEQMNGEFNLRYPGMFHAITGAKAIKYLLHNLDLQALSQEIRNDLKTATKQQKEKLFKRLEIVEAFLNSTNKPEWMIMDVVPVIPPDLRPMVQLEGGRFATTDINDLYHNIIIRNENLRKFIAIRAPQIMINNQVRLVQEAVDNLIDNKPKKNGRVAQNNKRPLKSLSDILRGKQGRFRQNLLGKRVDFSGRSVICVGPFLKMYQCGIPREMALTLFKPFVINYLRDHLSEQAKVDTTELQVQTRDNSKNVDIRRAKELIEKRAPEAMDALEKIVIEHPVLLNRAPTLHRLSIQAFEPVLVDGKAIRLHPLATTAFNADFDGDQMPVHVPLSKEAQTEARMLMLASKNILAPKDGKPVVTPSQDMIIGNYYLTIQREQSTKVYKKFEDLYKAYVERVFEHDNLIIVNDDTTKQYDDIEALRLDVMNAVCPSVANFKVVGREGKAFKDISEVEHAYEEHEIDFHTRFVIPGKNIEKPFVRFAEGDPDFEEKKDLNDELKDSYIVTTYGLMIFNQVFPDNFVYFNDPEITSGDKAKTEGIQYNLTVGTPKKWFLKKGTNFKEAIAKMPLGTPVKKKALSAIIAEVFTQCKLAETSLTLDKMKDLGFYYSTISGLTISAFDVVTLAKKNEIIAEADKKVALYNALYRRGTMLNSERVKNVVNIWTEAKQDIQKEIKKVMAEGATFNDIFLMADSGARGSADNFTQLAGMRGLMAKPNGESMEIPVKACFAEGMSMADFFNSTHGSRKGSTDTALKTAESGYLTRRLVDVSQDITITSFDCGSDKGLVMRTLMKKNGKDVLVPLKDRIIGRFTAKPIFAKVNGKKTQICARNEFIDKVKADMICSYPDVTEVEIRTNLTCNCQTGVCVKCYGSDLSTNGIVELGEVVGIVAAQSIGEPGTQLTMRTFHSGGVAGNAEDITQGLPRVQELFEARPPKGQGIISEIKGKVKRVEQSKQYESRWEIEIASPIEDNSRTYLTDAGKKACVQVGDSVMPGDLISDGAINPVELLRVASVDKVEHYILKEIQNAYRTAAGVEISDKHVEIIVKQMLSKVVVLDAGGTKLLPGTVISKSEFFEQVNYCWKNGLRMLAVKPIIYGITRSSLKSDSFLAAASFQETTRVLTEAAIRSKVDKLDGLKENIIIGGLIPAGTGLIDDVYLEEPTGEDNYDIRKL